VGYPIVRILSMSSISLKRTLKDIRSLRRDLELTGLVPMMELSLRDDGVREIASFLSGG
jgi:hypothetical protein